MKDTQYSPPYSISNKIVALISDISELLGQVSVFKDMINKPHLRKVNRIKSVHSSLKIEANSLSFEQVKDLIDGHLVIGDEKEILEVKNAYKAYEELPSLDPCSLADLKRVHKIMTQSLPCNPGKYRTGEEGVSSDGRCIFVAPLPQFVPSLMEQLFRWLKESEGDVHPLVRAAVFHYEFVFIHPFKDGNGRMARLWCTALLSRWKKVFEYIPLENQIEQFQQDYYEAIDKSNNAGNSTLFIEFMLEMIKKVLISIYEQAKKENSGASVYVKRMLLLMDYETPYTSTEIMDMLGLKSKENLRKNYLDPALQLGLLSMTIPEKPNSKNQRYIKK